MSGTTPSQAPTVRVCRSGFLINSGEVLPWWSGALHYWRVPRHHWAAALAGVHRLGCTIVETYVPWGVHEVGDEDYDFGSSRPELDLPAFFEAAQAAGLQVIARPGPHINAELTYMGFPERIVADPAMQARTSRDTPAFLPLPPRAFPAPSYASRRFLDAAGGWLRAAAAVLRPHLYPAGPVVAIQVDNECAHFFRGGPLDLDYHPDAIAAFRAFLEECYGDDRTLSRAWRQETSLATAEPPRTFEARTAGELVPHLDWAAYKECAVAAALAELAGVLREEGLGTVPLFHNLPPQDPAQLGLPAIERELDFCGVDYHHPARDYERIRQRVLYQCGTSVLPCAPELGAGSMLYGLPVPPSDQAKVILCCLMHGLRGANLYMAVDRDRWTGGALSPAGEPQQPLGPFIARLSQVIRDTRLFSRQRQVEVALVVPPIYRRLALVTQLLEAGPPMVLEYANLGPDELCREESFGLSEPVQLEQARAFAAITEALAAAQIPYEIVDGGADPVRLARYRVILCPTFETLDRALTETLAEAAQAGVQVLWGPRAPKLDERFFPQEGWHGAPWLTSELLADAGALAAALARLGLATPFPAREPEVNTTLFPPTTGDLAVTAPVLFVGTRSREPVTAHVRLDHPACFRDLLEDEWLVGEEEIEVALPAYGVRLLAVEPPERAGAPLERPDDETHGVEPPERAGAPLERPDDEMPGVEPPERAGAPLERPDDETPGVEPPERAGAPLERPDETPGSEEPAC